MRVSKMLWRKMIYKAQVITHKSTILFSRCIKWNTTECEGKKWSKKQRKKWKNIYVNIFIKQDKVQIVMDNSVDAETKARKLEWSKKKGSIQINSNYSGAVSQCTLST